MNDLMNLPSLILERLEENELILVRGERIQMIRLRIMGMEVVLVLTMAQVSVEESIILQGGVAN